MLPGIRAAWAALGGIVAITMIAAKLSGYHRGGDVREPNGLGHVAQVHAIVSMAEMGCLLVLKSIIVFYDSPHIDVQSELRSQGFRVVGNLAGLQSSLFHASAGRQCYLPLKRPCDGQLALRSPTVEIQYGMDCPSDISGGEFPNVHDFNRRGTRTPFRMGMEAVWFNADVGALEDVGIFLLFRLVLLDQLHLPVAGIGQINSRLAQHPSKCRQNESEYADEKAFVAVHKTNEGFRQPNGPASEIWGVYGVLGYLLVPLVALMARWDRLLRVWFGSLVLGCLLTLFGLI